MLLSSLRKSCVICSWQFPEMPLSVNQVLNPRTQPAISYSEGVLLGGCHFQAIVIFRVLDGHHWSLPVRARTS